MIKLVCCVLDKTLGIHAHPFVAHNEGSAIRDFGHACRDPNSALNKSPSDFSLVSIGEFDDETGSLTPHNHKLLAQAVQFIQE